MKKYIVNGYYTEVIYAENEDEALDQFDQISDEYAKEPFDDITIELVEFDDKDYSEHPELLSN